MLTLVKEALGFTEGWKEFVGDHSLHQGHFLVFTYDGHSEFSVVVFSKPGVEDTLALDAQPSEGELLMQKYKKAHRMLMQLAHQKRKHRLSPLWRVMENKEEGKARNDKEACTKEALKCPEET
ncbi:hypothetical protein EJB05_28827, partial [Eragrostis curvula]